MTALADLKVGWCPGALRPMASGDGLVVRIKPRGGALPLHAAASLAGLAARFGNGQLDLTARANLQVRGVTDTSLEHLLAGLHNLGLLDEDAEAEAVRNVVASPLAGIDSRACLDIRPMVAGLEDTLANDPAFRPLPAKWSFVVDDGGPFGLAGVAADIRFEAAPDGSMLVGLAADGLRAVCRAEDVPATAKALCRAALHFAPRRMNELVREHGARALFEKAGCYPVGTARQRQATSAQDCVGVLRVGAGAVLGVAPPFGSLPAADLGRLAEAALAANASELRLTPWRVLLLPGLTPANALGLKTMLESVGTGFQAAHSRAIETSGAGRQIGLDAPSPAHKQTPTTKAHPSRRDASFVTEADDALLGIAACSGLPACHRATTPVREDAAVIAQTCTASARGVQIHVSGCAKGCAHAQAAPWTLVGREGRYDLVRDGKAGDAPLWQDLSLTEVMTRMDVERAGRP